MFFSNFTSLYEFFGGISLALVGFEHIQKYFAKRFMPKVERYKDEWKKIDASVYTIALQDGETLRAMYEGGMIEKSHYNRYRSKLNYIGRYKSREIEFSKNILLNRTLDEEEAYAKQIVRLLAFWAALYCASILLICGLSLSNEFSFRDSDLFYLNGIANFTALSIAFYILFRVCLLANRVIVYYYKIKQEKTFASRYVNTSGALTMFLIISLISVVLEKYNIGKFYYTPITVLLGSIFLCLIPFIGLCDRYMIHLPLRVWNRNRTQRKIEKKIKALNTIYQDILSFRHPS